MLVAGAEAQRLLDVTLGLLGLAKEKLAVADLRVRDGQVSIQIQGPLVWRYRRPGVPFRKALDVQRSIGLLVQKFDVLQIQFSANFVVDVEVRQIWNGRRAPFGFALNLPEQLLETTGERRDVAKDALLSTKPQLVAILNKALGIPAECNCAPHILFRRPADQILEARGGDHAAAKPRGKAPPLQRENWQAHGESVRGCGMGPVGRRIEEKIGQRNAGEVVRVRGLVREKDAIGIYAAFQGGGA